MFETALYLYGALAISLFLYYCISFPLERGNGSAGEGHGGGGDDGFVWAAAFREV